MNPLRLLLPLTASAIATIANALDTSAWEFRQPIDLAHPGPVRVAIPAETLDAARADLGDLRLLGPDGAEIPFAIVRRNTVRPTTERIPLQGRLDGNATVIEFGLAKQAAIQRLTVETPATDFVKGASVEIEAEPGRWQRVVESAIVFRQHAGLEQLSLALAGARARTVRVRLENDRSDAIPVTAVIVETGARDPEQFIELPVVISAIEQEPNTTRVSLALGLRNRPLAELVLAAREGVFQRPVRLLAQRAADDEIIEDTLATGTLARLQFGEQRFEQLALKVDSVAPAAHLELAIDNGDSPALTELRVTARLRRVDVAFDAPAAGSYTFLAGAPAATAPRYDVAAFAADWGRLPSTDARAAARSANSSYRPAQVPVEVPEFGGPIDTTKWRHRRDILVAEPGAQVLELDATALARSRNDLGDLRLVRGDRQVPYLLERTSRMRTVPLALVAAPEAKRPTVGRWELALPVEGMPLHAVRVTINEPVFSRQLVLGEMVADSRGQPWPRILGTATIQRQRTGDPTVFTVALSTRPQGATLFLEIDHGDNAAFAPLRAEALYPVRRLRFRATETTGCALLYGNTAAAAPRYDLQLAAPRLLAAVQHNARLEAVGGAKVERPLFTLGGPAARYAFWGALAVVVAVLVWLVAKLLPKPPTA